MKVFVNEKQVKGSGVYLWFHDDGERSLEIETKEHGRVALWLQQEEAERLRNELSNVRYFSVEQPEEDDDES